MDDGIGSRRAFDALLPRIPRIVQTALRMFLGGAIAGQGLVGGASGSVSTEVDASSGASPNTLVIGRERRVPGLVLKLRERAGAMQARFASHRSHSSHASHASHASHYSSSSGSADDQQTQPAPPPRPATAAVFRTVKAINASARTITVTDAEGSVIEYALHDDTMIQIGSAPAVRLDDFQANHPGQLPVRAGQNVQVQSRDSADHKKIGTRVVIAEQSH